MDSGDCEGLPCVSGMSGLSCDCLISLSADISRADLGKMYVYDGPVGRISNKYRYGRTNNYPVDPPKGK